MNLAEQAEAFRNLTDEQYADIANGRMTVADMLAGIEKDRRAIAERIAAQVNWIPASQFAVVYDRERSAIVASGTIERCREIAFTMCLEYQSSAYVARAWKDNA